MNAVPLNRQEKDWERLGYSLSRTTMANWVIRCSEDYFSRFIARLKTEMLTEDVLHCDETYVKVLREKMFPTTVSNICGYTVQASIPKDR